MITKSIIKAAEKAMPFEEKLNAFYSKKAPRLITLGLITTVFSLLFWNIKLQFTVRWGYAERLGCGLLAYIAITAGACFFSSIKKFTMTKYIIFDVVAAAALFAGNFILSLGFIDLSLSDPYLRLLKGCWETGWIFYIPALMLSLLTGLFITRKKKA